MKAVITYILVCAWSLSVFSQNATMIVPLRGTLVDSATGKPLPGASVSVRGGQTDKDLKTFLTDEAGKFEYTGLPNQRISVLFEHVGYRKRLITLDSNANMDLGIILLSSRSSQLSNVTVTAARPLIRQELDRITYDVQADPENKAQSVLDMLRKVPLISINGEDNIKLKGSGSYKILINGRSSSLVARDPREAFKAMPAGTIQRIEIITTPPAKYDGEGLAGIINIITIKKSGDGYFASLGVRYNSVNGIAESASVTSRIGKIVITGSGNLYPGI